MERLIKLNTNHAAEYSNEAIEGELLSIEDEPILSEAEQSLLLARERQEIYNKTHDELLNSGIHNKCIGCED
jgi:N-acetylglutamate synthase-like GNAT family acetyltransferase